MEEQKDFLADDERNRAVVLCRPRKQRRFAANQALTLLRHIYNKAIQWGWEGRNPTAGIKKFHVEARDRFLAPDEIQRLFRHWTKSPIRFTERSFIL